MLEVGLTPSTSGEPGGNMTGQQCSHYITAGGPFEAVTCELLASGITLRWRSKERTGSAANKNKVKYICPECRTNAWAKPETHLVCGDCDVPMESEVTT